MSRESKKLAEEFITTLTHNEIISVGDRVDDLGTTTAEIMLERFRQDKKWGGKVHDESHSPQNWCMFIEKQIHMMRKRAGTMVGHEEYRQRFIKIAALAIAAIEVIDALDTQDAAIEQGG